MRNYKFERAERFNKAKAVFLTILLHAGMIGAVMYSGDVDIKEYIPDTVKEWVGMESGQEVAADTKPRP